MTTLVTHHVVPDGTHGAREYLLTNGLGGFALGCADARNRRRYHALLIGATTPPVGRVMALAAIADTLAVEDPAGHVARHALTDFAFAGWSGRHGLTPTAFSTNGVSATWTYAPSPGVRVSRSLTLADGRNAAEVTYRVQAPGRAWLELRPLVGLRDFHELVRGQDDRWRYYTTSDEAGATIYAGAWNLRLATTTGRFSLHPDWWWNFEYAMDLARGQDGREDLYCPGTFVCDCGDHGGEVTHTLAAWMDDGPMPVGLHAPKVARLQALVAGLRPDPREREPAKPGRPATRRADETLAALAVAADQFVVVRNMPHLGRRTSIIAGYPWFSDWGRDTMIALPGLLLTTGRHAEALNVLTTFAAMRRDGLIPNCFDDATGQAQYNTADASLWFIHAAGAYLASSEDTVGYRTHLLPACVDILTAYRRGTEYGIRMDPDDALIAAGDAGTQLTWMDAARDGVVFTPRFGKAVEINALWIDGLKQVGRAKGRAGQEWLDLAIRAEGSFLRRFWCEETGCLFDRLEPDGDGGWRGVAEVRPNQVYALALDVALPRERAASVLRVVRERLLTPRGVRTLAPGSPGYRGRYKGSLFERDGAYHNGTAWPYLLGMYAQALLDHGGDDADVMAALGGVLDDLLGRGTAGAPIGTIAEVYDGEAPQDAGGCPAQAWSVAEVLQAYVASLRG
ncbi:MAG: glycogen debranching protein [Phycisphaerae bacterium]|nr:MAG: glycogen debranching protein [Phycisphaerae bacterium]